ncbi:putative RNA methyltransferase [Paenibacillus konkukensis]|uniref:putative RNA methyltransferase n=1 Tax=Paenibacillus konkukensis TaxID=2020716 RepID=UPI00201DA596|nr:rRNA (guanine-N1)-methyltransferase [Paenibacillus konkukensis]
MSKKENKRTVHAGVIAQNEAIFRCPLCSSPMRMAGLQSLICSQRHCFDLSRQGYINLLPRPLETKYDKRMFEARRMLCGEGLFEPLHAAVSDTILKRLGSGNAQARILDAGCGEGSHLSGIRDNIVRNAGRPPLTVGLDISRDGIGAATAYANAIWCVGDIAACPFAGGQFGFILNMLSPANYAEFRRLMTADGMVIKVIPERDYLKELRGALYGGLPMRTFANDRTLQLFRENFRQTDAKRVRYRFPLDKQLLEPLLRMTPLSWRVTEERLQQVLAMSLPEITIDLMILTGEK